MIVASPADNIIELPSLFKIGRNCWRLRMATQASMLVDCAQYYRALHSALSKAQHSIFILGWDIDSRIELLRGDDAKKTTAPTAFFDLIQWKAKQNPDLKIYLNKWNYTLFFAGQRELFAEIKWRFLSLPNIYYTTDNHLPLGASHHQKIVIVDDEIAFCGGMDVALCRWDHRHHHVQNPQREDPGGMYEPFTKACYGPYHDIQMLVAGPVVQDLAHLTRERWRRATDIEPLPIRLSLNKNMPPAWPDNSVPDFESVRVAVARTLPSFRGISPAREIEQLYMDEIAQAEKFIYIENQFLTHLGIAQALNKRLKEKPGLRVLAVSSFNPEGIMETKAFWSGRVLFRKALEEGVEDRIVLAFPISQEHGQANPVRIHSKIMIVDDRFLHVGSSNLNYRSMNLDTECDLVIEGLDSRSRSKIASLRSDLIREHTGQEIESIEHIIQQGKSVQSFLQYLPHSRQHLQAIDDTPFEKEVFARIAQKIADPQKPFVPSAITTLWGFILKGFVFLPLTLFMIGVVLAFGPIQGFLIGFSIIIISAVLGFWLGRRMSLRGLRILVGLDLEKINQHLYATDIKNIAIIRLLPTAPFNAVNLVLGFSKIPWINFIAGTVIGIVPGLILMTVLGNMLLQLWHNFA